MIKRFKALSFYAIFWMTFFFFARLFFIFFQYKNSFRYNPGELLATFYHGSALDISTTGYYMILPVLFSVIGLYFNGNWYKNSLKWYTWFLILFSSVIVVADANLYSYWGFRMDYTPMLYLKTPAEAMASVSTLKILMFLLTIVIISALFIWLYNRFISKLFDSFDRPRYWLPAVPLFLLLWGALLIPIRGGIGLAPINAGTVYFSSKMYLNHTAVNAVWNVGTTAFTQKPVKNPYVFGDIKKAEEKVKSLVAPESEPEKVLSTERPNIIIIVLESFSGYLIGPLGGDSTVTPNINRYAREGLLFTNFYASGTRTDKAIPAILDGYPAQPAQSIIKEPKKTQSLPSLVKILNAKGYNSAFWYGGEINFANFNSFVIGSGFHSIITKNNFSPEFYNSKWGVHDHIMFGALEDSMKVVKEPFLKVVLTLSSHEPFDVPMKTKFEGKDNVSKYKNSVFYADRSLGGFLDWAKTTDWWKNTLIVMVADHCARITSDMPIFTKHVFRIPMIWTGGALVKTGYEVKKTGNQVDIPVTILDQMGIKSDFPFAKDLLSDKSNSFSFYTFNEGFGFVTDSSWVSYDLKQRKTILSEGSDPSYAEDLGKSYLQVLFDDYLKR
jgi:phosphoglycerol transferase MdoB-like AlkP superfamily enzyme